MQLHGTVVLQKLLVVHLVFKFTALMPLDCSLLCSLDAILSKFISFDNLTTF